MCGGMTLLLDDLERQETRFAITIPCGLSLLAAHDPNAEVLGLDAFPAEDRPDPRIVHPAFQIMVGIGTFLMALAAWAGGLAQSSQPSCSCFRQR